MRHISILTACLGLMFFTACGGGGDESPFPKPPTGPTNQGFTDLGNAANKAKESCTSSATASIMPFFTTSPGGNTASLAPLLASLSGQCETDFTNMLMIFTTLQYQGQNGGAALFANSAEGRRWITKQVASMMNAVGRNMMAQGVSLTPENLNKAYQFALQFANNIIIPKLPAHQQAIAMSELNSLTANSTHNQGTTSHSSTSATPTSSTNLATSNTFNPSVNGTLFSTTSNFYASNPASPVNGTISTTSSVGTNPSNNPYASYGKPFIKLGQGKGFTGNPANYGGFVPVY